MSSKNGEFLQVNNPSDMPEQGDIDTINEPFIKAEIIAPAEFIGSIMKLCMSKRGIYRSTNYLSTNKVQLIFDMPLGEIIYDFFN